MSGRAFYAITAAAVFLAVMSACASLTAAADTAAPVISQITPANDAAGKAGITADIADASGILSAKVSYAVNPFWGCIWPYYWSGQAAMTVVSGGIYKAVLSETLKNKDRICIKVEAKDASPRQNSGSARYPANPYIVSGVAPPDTTAPLISAVNASAVTFNSANIGWTTDEAADTQVEYGLTTGYGASTPLDAANVFSHGRALSGLSAENLYHYRVRSRDAAGNLAVSADAAFTTSRAPDTQGPSVAITAPAGGSTLSGTIAVSGTASDNVRVASVEFYVDGALAATDAASPYGFTWDTTKVAGGSHTLTAKAYDAAGNPPGAHSVSVTVSNGLADLDVLFIERSPMYNGFHGHVCYTKGYPEICPADYVNTKRWPDAGETVTFTANIKNTGTSPANAMLYQWKVDGVVVANGSLPELAEGAVIQTALNWRWQAGDHILEFAIDSNDAIREPAETNNTLSEYTNALSLYFQIEQAAFDYFKTLKNRSGSAGFHDWIRIQAEELGARFKRAAVNGSFEKLRVGKVQIFNNGELPCGGTHANPSDTYDGVWGWQLQGSSPCGDAYSRTHLSSIAGGIEESLLHELGHQLGLIDNYNMDIPADKVQVLNPNGNPVSGTTYLPKAEWCKANPDCPVYYNRAKPSLMSDASGELHLFDASGLYSNLGKRRGYFGDYLYDLPQNVKLKIVDANNQPMPGANLYFYQRQTNGTIPNTVVFQGTTDNQGTYALPNRTAASVLTYTNHQLRPNPFGQVDVVGGNGTLLFRADYANQFRYFWLDISELVVAYHQGSRNEAAFTRTFTGVTADNAPPVLSSVSAYGVTSSGANIAWTTDEPADTQVEYGLTAGYGTSTPLDAANVFSHIRALSGLNTETLYHYRVRSRDAAGNLAVSGDYTFTTAAPPPTILNNGPITEKVDIVFLGDGYTASEMAAYRADVQTFTDYLFTQPPFSDYKSFFNVHRVDVVSNQSGTDNPNCNGTQVDTALDTGFQQTSEKDCRLLFTSAPAKVANAAAEAPAADVVIIIVNTPVYGGAATYGGYGVFYRGGRDVMVHELGHSFGLLADEYEYGGPETHGGGEPSEPNVTVNTSRAGLKWGQWVQPATPLPTTASASDAPGLYEGAHYSRRGVYRPTYNSKMRSLGVHFERINYSLLVDRIFDYVPQDTTPPQASLTCGRPAGGKMPVALAASDPESYVMAYRVSASASFEDTAWQLASNKASFALDLPSMSVNADARIYAQVRNGYGTDAAVNCSQGSVAGAVSPDLATVVPAVLQDRLVTVSIPPNSFSDPVTLTIKTPRSLPLSADLRESPKSTGIGMEITLDRPVQPAKHATIEVSYADSEVAGLNKPDLVLARYDETGKTWVPLESVSYPEINKVAGRTRHFSLFQVMQAKPMENLSSARISQNPFYPKKGQGKVTFKYLPAGTSVIIYTLLGELVWKGTADGAGIAEWRGLNRSGREVANGLYVVYLETGGSKKTMKLSVVK